MDARKRGAEVLHFNQQREDLRTIAEQQQREQDLLLLEMALEKERRAIEGAQKQLLVAA
jgi:hypothetical protein